MTDKERLARKGLNLYLFDGELWERNGIYIDELHTIFINDSLSDEEIHKILLHEIGHEEHTPSLYKIAQIRCENEANRFMIHELLKEELENYDDVNYFNWLNFANKYDLKTVTEQLMIQDEFYKLVSGI